MFTDPVDVTMTQLDTLPPLAIASSNSSTTYLKRVDTFRIVDADHLASW
jgi:hypothetical protein